MAHDQADDLPDDGPSVAEVIEALRGRRAEARTWAGISGEPIPAEVFERSNGEPASTIRRITLRSLWYRQAWKP